jgi:hypothetical protein
MAFAGFSGENGVVRKLQFQNNYLKIAFLQGVSPKK